MERARKNLWLFVGLALLSVSCDRGSKIWAREALTTPRQIVAGVFDLRLVENPGGAFSLFRDWPPGRYLLIAVGLGILALLVAAARRRAQHGWLYYAALGMVAGGAVGNLYDRIVYGRVTDFLHAHWGAHHWPVFNVADALLVVGGIALMLAPRYTPN